ncbi:MAG TPA: HD domain-containing protein [Nitrospirota bacterium]|nr:HD domain-containing protein [Nitrospirota bacterium]
MVPQTLEYLSQLIALTPQPVYLVGGSVRDLLIGTEDIKDIDTLMQSGSESVAQAFADAIGGSFFFLDEERKISRVVRSSDGGIIQFDFTNFEGPDLAADLGRRDFTINAMALDLREFLKDKSLANIIDLFHGKKDVTNKLIRVVKPEVLDEDPLRLLRAVRFASTLGFTIEETTKDHIKSRTALVTQPSPERQRDELFLILSERNAETHLNLMDSLGLLSRLLPELDTLTGFSPGRYHIYDVRTHSIKAAGYVDSVLDDLPGIAPEYVQLILEHLDQPLENLVPRKAALRFACLLHDIAKPETLSQDGEGRIHFYGHDNLGAEKAKEICRRLRLSRDTEATVTAVIKQHMRLFNLSAPGGPSKNAMHRYCRDLKDALPESLVLAQADARATLDIMPKEKFTDTEKPMAAVLEYYYEKFLKAEEKPLVTGNDLIERGLKPGPRFREILDEIKERQAAGLLKDRREALEFIDGLK